MFVNNKITSPRYAFSPSSYAMVHTICYKKRIKTQGKWLLLRVTPFSGEETPGE